MMKENWLVLSQSVRILTWKNYRLAYGSPPALCGWLDRAYFEEINNWYHVILVYASDLFA